MKRGQCRGQSTAEYAVLIALVVGAVIAMQTFVKRGIQAKMYDATTSMTNVDGGQILQGHTPQYEPYYAQNDVTTGQKTKDLKEVYKAGEVTRQGSTEATRLGTETEGGAALLGSDDQWTHQ